MKPLFFFFLSLLYVQQCEAQKAVVANLRENVAYVGLVNPLGILVEGYKWEDVEVSTDNGTIEMLDDSYEFLPKNAGLANIVLKSKTKDTLGKAVFRVKYIPDPTPEMGGQNKGEVKKSHLILYPGISPTLKGFAIDVRFKIINFSVVIIRNGHTLFTKNNYSGPLFSGELKEEFKKTQAGDKVIFYELSCKGPDLMLRYLLPMEFTIVE